MQRRRSRDAHDGSPVSKIEAATMKRLWREALGISLVTCAVFAAAAQPVAPKPAINVGDAWEFKGLLEPDGKPNDWTRTVVEVAPNDVLKIRQQDDRVVDYDGALNFMPEGRADYARVLVKYPLKVGDEWEMSRKFPNPQTEEAGKAKVVAFETITVPAGTFQCYRIEAEAWTTNRSARERRSWKRWYCPDVKWIAKELLETTVYGTATRTTSTSASTSELVKFTPGK
jgi:hypothetical protein